MIAHHQTPIHLEKDGIETQERRNSNLFAKAGKKLEQHWDSYCNYPNFHQMYTNIECHLIHSGNADKFETPPVHMDVDRNILVEDASLAFRHPVTINIVHCKNVFA